MIDFKNVSLIYPNAERTIVENLSFTLAEGEMVLVIGETGAGKSSILKLMNGIIPHHTGGILHGEITIAGRSTSQMLPGQLADVVGVVGQNPSATFVCDIVEDEIAFTLENLGLSADSMRKRVEEILDLLALAPLRRREITTLSGGEQQRVAIAAALATQPKVLILDEPTSALDPIAAEEVLSILHRLVHDLGLTVVLAEHRLERVIQFVDRILLIHGNGKARIGNSREILAGSPIAPAIVELSRLVKLPEVALTIREFRRESTHVDLALTDDVEGSISAADNPIVLSFNGVSARYDEAGSIFALRNIDFDVRAGEIVALMGRNGAGKSTLLKSVIAQSPVISGQVLIAGRPPEELTRHELISYVGYVPQEPSDLLFSDSVRQECEVTDKDLGISIGRTLDIYRTLMPIPSEMAHPRDISEGQRLGLALSIMLAASPHILILDEPTRGLDYSAKKSLVEILKRISRDESRAVVIATHDVELVADLADRVLFLADGELVADGSAAAILTSSPAFAPQTHKAFTDSNLINVDQVARALRGAL